MNFEQSEILVFGYGNQGRLDDGLGPAFAEVLQERRCPKVSVESDYQLNVEDAAMTASHRIVLFVDAAVKGPEPFFIRKVEAKPHLSFTSHSLDPASVLSLAAELFGASVNGYTIGIRGYDFNEFGEKLSGKAQMNLEATLDFLLPVLEEMDFYEIRRTLDLVSEMPTEGEERCKIVSM